MSDDYGDVNEDYVDDDDDDVDDDTDDDVDEKMIMMIWRPIFLAGYVCWYGNMHPPRNHGNVYTWYDRLCMVLGWQHVYEAPSVWRIWYTDAVYGELLIRVCQDDKL